MNAPRYPGVVARADSVPRAAVSDSHAEQPTRLASRSRQRRPALLRPAVSVERERTVLDQAAMPSLPANEYGTGEGVVP